MVSQRLKTSCLAALSVLLAGAAQAADYSPPPPPVIEQPPPPAFGGWYLRGQVGVGLNAKPDIEYLPAPANVGNGFAFEHNDISDAVFVGGGVGYYFNNWLRFDATAEYRTKSRVSALGIYDQQLGIGDAYQGYIDSWVFLANAYVDLGTWDCFTPFVGAGIGGAYNTLTDFVDTGFGTTGRGYGRNSSNWSLAWALYAGVAFDVTKNLKVDLSYRYLNYGSVTDTIDCVGGCNADSYKFSNLHSHDIMLGLRWTCCEVAPPPQYVYQPPPPPPISSRG
ncbi:MAG TPA: outer membrane beta-barrel protein [Pseudolabrys sp.]|nr:outer membrane beta-barrel protein [Pseudolabrys sp.]